MLNKKIYCLMLLVISGCLFSNSVHAIGIDQKAWNLICDKNSACRVFGYIQSDDEAVVSSFSLMYLKGNRNRKSKLVGMVMLPLGLHIPSGVNINFDKKVSVKANLVECRVKGCRAIFTAEKVIVDQMKRGNNMFITIIDSKSRKGLRLQYSLVGFTKTYNEFLTRVNL